MSHDRGCFICFEDSASGCVNKDCPKLRRGKYDPVERDRALIQMFTGLELDASLRSSWLSMFMQNGLREGNEDVGA